MIANYIVDFVFDPDCKKERKDLCKQIIEQRPTSVFLNIAWEAYEFNPSILEVDEFLYQQGIQTTWIIWDIVKSDPGWLQLRCPVVFLNFQVWRCYNEIIVRQTNPVNQHWNSEAEKFLFLTGKPNKPQRIGLLYKLHKNRLMNKCVHSLFISQGMYEDSRRHISELSDSEFAEFVQRYQHTPDNIQPDMQEHSMHYGGIPYDAGLYTNSLFRLVSESNLYKKPAVLSEKTYITILNKNPFVIAGDRHSCKYLRDHGFEPFDQIFDIPTYDNIVPVDVRLNQTVNHVKQWLAGNFDKNAIKDMVEHNYANFIKLGKKIKEDFENATGTDIDLAVCSKDSNHIAMLNGW